MAPLENHPFSSASGRSYADAWLALLLVLAVAGGSLYRIIHSGSIESGFDGDVHLALALARRYLAHPPDLMVMDMYTQGFIHPLLYVPLLAVLRRLSVPSPLQDGLAAATVQIIALGLMTLLAYVGCRACLRKGPAATIVLICFIPPLLLLPIDSAQTQISPNAEILGGVLLLALWALIRLRTYVLQWQYGVIFLIASCFHLKYQLIPQALALIAISSIPLKRRLFLIAWSLAACLVIDILVYRFNGEGFTGRILSLLQDYMGVLPNQKPQLMGVRVMLVKLIVQLFVVINTLSQSMLRMLSFVLSIFRESPQFIMAWLAWGFVLLSRRAGKNSLDKNGFWESILLSAITLIAIILPGKGFSHYYLLLIPTSVVVLSNAFENPPFHAAGGLDLKMSSSSIHRLMRQSVAGWIFSTALSVAILIWNGQSIVAQYNVVYPDGPPFLLPTDAQNTGLHVYGWNTRIYGLQNTFPSGLSLSYHLTKTILNSDPKFYADALLDQKQRPEFILDQLASKSQRSFLGDLGYEPLEKMASKQGFRFLDYYKIRQVSELGILYEKIR